MSTVHVCGPRIKEDKLEYVYWRYSKVFPRRWKRRECDFCRKSVIPPKLYIVRRVPNKEFWEELAEQGDLMTLQHLYDTNYLACEECLEGLNPKKEGKY